MKKILIFAFLVLSIAALRAQSETVRYIPRVSGGDVQLVVVVTRAPSGASGYSNSQFVYHTDTVTLRSYINSERTYWLAEATRLNDAAEAAQARADSLYAALVVLNGGIGAVDGPVPLREPVKPGESPARWGAILKNDENEIG
jgi:hypothetical protein